jgi:hypothetical protein
MLTLQDGDLGGFANFKHAPFYGRGISSKAAGYSLVCGRSRAGPVARKKKTRTDQVLHLGREEHGAVVRPAAGGLDLGLCLGL